MKKRIPELVAEYDNAMKEALSKKGISYLGNSLSLLNSSSKSY
jgi:hypothetical protein